MAPNFFLYEDKTPRAPKGKRSYELDKVLRTLLCATGATCPSGRAPPGPIVRRLRGRRGGKKKGKDEAMQEADGDDEDC